MQTAQLLQPPVPGEIFAGKYLITERLGEGGMGVVFAAHNGTTEQGFPCAIKWLKPEAVRDKTSVRRFLREADVAGYIKSDYVVKVFDKHEDPTFIVMERLVGESLREHLERLGRPLTLEEVVPIMAPVLRAVRAAHRAELPTGHGVLHRDLKPENIFLDLSADGTGPTPKVLDFGIAKLLEPTTSVTMETTELVRGTPLYMAREQLFEPENVGPWTDVHALGVIFYELLSGQRPFDGQTTFDVCLKVREGIYRPLVELVPGLPEGLAEAIERAFHPERDQRYQSVADFEVALHPFLGELPGSSVGLPPRPELGGPTRVDAASPRQRQSSPPPAQEAAPVSAEIDALSARSRRPLIIVAACVALLGGAVAWLWHDSTKPELDATAPKAETAQPPTRASAPDVPQPRPSPTLPAPDDVRALERELAAPPSVLDDTNTDATPLPVADRSSEPQTGAPSSSPAPDVTPSTPARRNRRSSRQRSSSAEPPASSRAEISAPASAQPPAAAPGPQGRSGGLRVDEF